jgi:iron complex transport system substrate-binding protein
MRVVSLLPSATEMICALGQADFLVGRTHECDYPPEVRRLPALTSSKLSVEEPSAVLDAQVQALVREALAIYRVDAAALEALRPDLIVTQTQCDVCAVSLRDVEEALRKLSSRPRLIALTPLALEDVYRDLRTIADGLEVPERGASLERELRERMAASAARASRLRAGRSVPRVACIEWIDPLMTAGNWTPRLVELAGGRAVLAEAGRHSSYVELAALAAADPDVVVVMPCGFDIARIRRELPTLAARPEWAGMRAVREGRVYLADGNQYFNRPGPRLAESLDILIEILAGSALGLGFVRATIPGTGASDIVPAAGPSSPGQAQGEAMAQDSIRMSAVFPATASEIYEAWLDPARHAKFTGGTATIEARVGGRHTAWDGYIEGTILELMPGQRIVQSWRSLDFPQEAPDSRLEIVFADAPGGTELTLVHTEIPEGQGVDYEEGWKEHYFKPMQRFFSPVAVPAPTAPVPTAAPKKAAVSAKPAKKPKAKVKAKTKAKAKPKTKTKAKPKKMKAAPKKKAKKAAPKKKAKKAAAKKKTKGKKR